MVGALGGDWQQLIQQILIGLIFSFLLAKLISFLTSFHHSPLSLSRNTTQTQVLPTPVQPDQDQTETSSRFSDDGYSVLAEKGSVAGTDSFANLNDVVAEKGSVESGDSDDDDDDWEGVESTELDEAFSAATAFVAATAADRVASKGVSQESQLKLYGLYKIATEGPCGSPPPPAFKMTARAKWNAWQKMGAMPPEDAMQKYVEIVTELFPTWFDGGSDNKKGGDVEESKGGPMGPVFSSYIHEEESGNELKMDAIHGFAREGDVDNLLKCIESGFSVNSKDGEGRTPLHWAVDRGHLGVIELLLSKNADVDAKDDEGQTPLHYAVVCDREGIAEYLVKHNAEVSAEDNDGTTPSELCEKNWPFMQAKDM